MSYVPHAATNIPAQTQALIVRNGGQLLTLFSSLLEC